MVENEESLQHSENFVQGHFEGLGTLNKFFPYKLMVFTSSFYIIIAYERFHENALHLERHGKLV